MNRTVLTLCIFITLTSLADADFIQCRDKNGNTLFTNSAPPPGAICEGSPGYAQNAPAAVTAPPANKQKGKKNKPSTTARGKKKNSEEQIEYTYEIQGPPAWAIQQAKDNDRMVRTTPDRTQYNADRAAIMKEIEDLKKPVYDAASGRTFVPAGRGPLIAELLGRLAAGSGAELGQQMTGQGMGKIELRNQQDDMENKMKRQQREMNDKMTAQQFEIQRMQAEQMQQKTMRQIKGIYD
jgi:hypothetical protein